MAKEKKIVSSYIKEIDGMPYDVEVRETGRFYIVNWYSRYECDATDGWVNEFESYDSAWDKCAELICEQEDYIKDNIEDFGFDSDTSDEDIFETAREAWSVGDKWATYRRLHMGDDFEKKGWGFKEDEGWERDKDEIIEDLKTEILSLKLGIIFKAEKADEDKRADKRAIKIGSRFEILDIRV